MGAWPAVWRMGFENTLCAVHACVTVRRAHGSPRTRRLRMADAAADNYAPYASYKNVQAVITRYRDRGLPDPLTNAELERIGIPGGMAPRTLRALRFLGLVDEDGNRQEPFERLKRATTDEYPGQLAELVQSAYLPVFQIVDPAQDSDTVLADAFRRFEPSAQREKMIALFRGLAEEAEIIPRGKPKQREGGRKAEQPAKPRTITPKVKAHAGGATGTGTASPAEVAVDMPDYRLVQAVIQQLPREPRWTAAKRNRWIAALTAAVDLVFEIEEGGGRE